MSLKKEQATAVALIVGGIGLSLLATKLLLPTFIQTVGWAAFGVGWMNLISSHNNSMSNLQQQQEKHSFLQGAKIGATFLLLLSIVIEVCLRSNPKYEPFTFFWIFPIIFFCGATMFGYGKIIIDNDKSKRNS